MAYARENFAPMKEQSGIFTSDFGDWAYMETSCCKGYVERRRRWTLWGLYFLFIADDGG